LTEYQNKRSCPLSSGRAGSIQKGDEKSRLYITDIKLLCQEENMRRFLAIFICIGVIWFMGIKPLLAEI